MNPAVNVFVIGATGFVADLSAVAARPPEAW